MIADVAAAYCHEKHENSVFCPFGTGSRLKGQGPSCAGKTASTQPPQFMAASKVLFGPDSMQFVMMALMMLSC